MVDLSSKIHSSTRVAEGAGISPSTLRGYYKREVFRVLGKPHAIGAGDDAVESRRELADRGGQPHRYNARGAMHIALAVELIRYGVDGLKAFNLALHILVGDESREPGGCCHPANGETIFIFVRPEPTDEEAFTWLGSEDDFEEHVRPLLRTKRSFLTINVSQLEGRMFAALGIAGHSWDAIDPNASIEGELVN